MARLGDYVQIRTGKLDANAASENGQYPFFTCAVDPLRIDTYSYECECVLVAGNGDLNVKYYNGKFDAYQRTYIIESKDKTVLTVPYLFCFLDKYVETLRQQAIGGVIKYIKLGNLTEADIPIPSIAEQEKIVENLSKSSELIALRKEQLAKLDELVKARFVECSIVWECNQQKLQSFLEDITYGFTNPMPDAEVGPWKITAKDIVDGKVNYATARRTTEGAFEELTAKSKPSIGDVLLTKDGTLGRCAVVEESGMCVNQSVAVLKCNKRILPKFLAILLQMPEYQQEMLKNAGGGTIKHIYITRVVDMLVSVPDILAQRKFLTFVEQTGKSKLTIQASLDKLEVMKKALMQEYFG